MAASRVQAYRNPAAVLVTRGWPADTRAWASETATKNEALMPNARATSHTATNNSMNGSNPA